MISALVQDIAAGNDRLFKSIDNMNGQSCFKANKLGKKLISVLRTGEAEFEYHFPIHTLNPYAELLFRCAARAVDPYLPTYLHSILPHETQLAVIALNQLVEDIRNEARSVDFQKLIRRFSRAEKKRTTSLDLYIDALFEKYSRLVVIRVDLAYKAGSFSGLGLNESLKQVKGNWASMQSSLHNNKPVRNLVGFACTLEYGYIKGFHFHLLAFYDGSIYRKDIVLARMIGMYWVEEVTDGRGIYYNCNKYKHRYRRLGIGVLNHHDFELIDNLKHHVSSYLVKVDYWVRLLPRSGRSFFRGNMPRLDAVKKGRPRKT
ncbi:MAG: inovirus-type Gp2 protein [Cyclobacteriaceae bacterium]